MHAHDDLFWSREQVMEEIDTAASTRGPRQTPTDAWIERFVGFGAQGPARSLFGKGPSPAFARLWAWKPEAWLEPHPRGPARGRRPGAAGGARGRGAGDPGLIFRAVSSGTVADPHHRQVGFGPLAPGRGARGGLLL